MNVTLPLRAHLNEQSTFSDNGTRRRNSAASSQPTLEEGMPMKLLDLGSAGDPGFEAQIAKLAHTSPAACYACGKCSAGCPLSYEMDYQPHQVLRLVQLGLKDEALSCSTIWLCASCITCSTRCPREVDIAQVMDTLRAMARTEGVRAALPKVPKFYSSFLDRVQAGGRLHELSMTILYKLRSGDLFSDLDLGIKMILRGKLKPLPPRIQGRDQVRQIFRRVAEAERREGAAK